MLNRVGQSLRIGLAPDCAALIATSHWRPSRVTVLGERAFTRDADPEAIGQQLDGLLECAPVRGRLANLVVSDELARAWTVTPPAGATCMADLEAAAALRFHALFGASHQDWRISADWNPRMSFLAVAMPTSLLKQLERSARAHRMHFVEIVPQFVAALNGSRALRRNGAWVGLVDADVLTLSVFDGDAFMAVRTTKLPASADREWLDTFLEREALRLGAVLPSVLQFSGDVPMGWRGEKGRLEFECTLLNKVSGIQTAPVRLACAGITP